MYYVLRVLFIFLINADNLSAKWLWNWPEVAVIAAAHLHCQSHDWVGPYHQPKNNSGMESWSIFIPSLLSIDSFLKNPYKKENNRCDRGQPCSRSQLTVSLLQALFEPPFLGSHTYFLSTWLSFLYTHFPPSISTFPPCPVIHLPFSTLQ